MASLVLSNIHVSVEDKEILRGINLTINPNETHALMGPNGNGKSTLLNAIMGHPNYTVTQGSMTYDGQDLLTMSVDERARLGVFLAMQYPMEIPGVTNSDFLRAAMNARRETPVPLFQFIKEMEKTIQDLEMKPDLAHRFLNEGFSGGEKKRNEIVQMKMLRPSLAMLDEIDSGLDVDALKIVAEAILDIQKEIHCGLLVVSHYERFYTLIRPTHTHILIDGKIVKEGDFSLVDRVDKEGYDWIYKELNLEPVKEKAPTPISLGACAAQIKSATKAGK